MPITIIELTPQAGTSMVQTGSACFGMWVHAPPEECMLACDSIHYMSRDYAIDHETTMNSLTSNSTGAGMEGLQPHRTTIGIDCQCMTIF